MRLYVCMYVLPIVRGRWGWACNSRSCSGRRIRRRLPAPTTAVPGLDDCQTLLRFDAVHLFVCMYVCIYIDIK